VRLHLALAVGIRRAMLCTGACMLHAYTKALLLNLWLLVGPTGVPSSGCRDLSGNAFDGAVPYSYRKFAFLSSL